VAEFFRFDYSREQQINLKLLTVIDVAIMPPPIPRPMLNGMLPLATFRSVLRARTTNQWRPNSTNSLPPANIITPPESPRYVPIPELPQSTEFKLGPVRGHLPVPRKVFAKRAGGTEKGKRPGAYVQSIRPLSAAEQAGLPPKSAQEAQRWAETARRRTTLREGLKGLYERKVRFERTSRARSLRNFEVNKARALAPEGLDDVYTRPTVRADTRDTAVPLDPLRFERADAARERTSARAALKSEARRDALAQLYVAARDFIVDEEELEKRVEHLFRAEYFTERGNATSVSESVWDSMGKPQGVRDMVGMMDGTSFGWDGVRRDSSSQTTLRQKKVSEELTGGKLD
jgi:hypothetical protein